MINIMYHYVRPSSEEYPNLNSLDIKIFKRQLDYFEKEYGYKVDIGCFSSTAFFFVFP